jgi:hypothetical protein
LINHAKEAIPLIATLGKGPLLFCKDLPRPVNIISERLSKALVTRNPSNEEQPAYLIPLY